MKYFSQNQALFVDDSHRIKPHFKELHTAHIYRIKNRFKTMGVNSSRTGATSLSDDDVNFDHFQILRAIGKGSFGKVCIVQKRDSGRLFAMKYVSRGVLDGKATGLGGVIKEVELLSSLEHPFLVNLWFSFQDEEDLFMVCDLLTGGDLRYHLLQQVEFSERSVSLLVCELGSALEYLQHQRVIHRDIKPDNILLDEGGHAHLTDFNIATRLQNDGLACSMSGTKPYIAPEVFLCALDQIAGYSYPVDWWSLGVVAYEMRAGSRPFVIHSTTPVDEVRDILHTEPSFPRNWSTNFKELIQKLLDVNPDSRISCQTELSDTMLLRHINFQSVLEKSITPPFKPPTDHLNCDPSLELEEMIVEAKPLHKKKKRLAKQRSAQRDSAESSNAESNFIKEFIVYNRCKELQRKAMELKEKEWQEELNRLMANSEVKSLGSIKEASNEHHHTATMQHDDIQNEQHRLILSKSIKEVVQQITDAKNTKTQTNSIIDSDNIDFIDRTPSPKSTE